jgi:hypothetical protein
VGWLLRLKRDIVATALQAPDMNALWEARAMVAYHPDWVWALLPALRDRTFLDLREAGDVSVVGRHTPFPGHRRSARSGATGGSRRRPADVWSRT